MQNIWNFIIEHYGAIIWGLVAFIWVIVRLTPTTKDDRIMQFIVTILNFIIPDRKKKKATPRERDL